MSMRSSRLPLIILGLLGYFLVTIGAYWAFFVWVAGLFLMSRFLRREDIRYMMLGGVAINLIVAVIAISGLGIIHQDESFWEALKRGVVEHLVLAAIVALILFVVFMVLDGHAPKTNK